MFNFLVAQDTSPISDLTTLLYFTLAGFITLAIETLRRWVKHRMDLWESEHPIPRKKDDDEPTQTD